LETSNCSFRLPISASQLSLPEPPDGGWGWVVVIAAFFVHMVTEGVIVSFGIFIEDLVHEFQESMSATSWVGSFSYGVPALATPISSLVINHYGCRFTCMLGAVISALGCLFGCFANSLLTLVFTFGILSGIGTSLSMTAALVIVSVYFDDKRATATGLSIAGTGVGALVFAPAVEAFLNIYTWRGTFMLMAGALLNIAVCGALMRPVETRSERRQRQRLAWLEHFAKESGLPHLTKSAEYLNTDVLGRIKFLRDRLLAPTKSNVNRVQALQNGSLNAKEAQRGIIRPNGISCIPNPLEVTLTECIHGPSKLMPQVSPLAVIPEDPSQISENPFGSIKPYASVFNTQIYWQESGNFSASPHQSQESRNYLTQVKPPDIGNSVVDIRFFRSGDVYCEKKDVTGLRHTKSFPCLKILFSEKKQQNPSPIGFMLPQAFLTNNAHEKSEYTKTKPRRRCAHLASAQNQQEIDCRNWIETATRSKPLEAFNHPYFQNTNEDLALCGAASGMGDEITVHNSTYEHADYLYRSSLIKAFGLNRASRCTALSLPDLTRVHRIRRRPSNSSSSSSSSDSSFSAWYCCGDLDTADNICARILSKCFAPCQIILPELDAKYLFQRLCDVRLFRRSTFDLFVLSNFLLYFWYNVTYFFMGVHALDLGLSETSAALLFSVLGGANMIGEVVVGLLADRECVDALMLYLVMLLACGLSTALVPLFKSFLSLSLYSSKSLVNHRIRCQLNFFT
uniref:MFS domain-containing protein n=1 Tax=Echinostoma caproni TaxID=27848 RepID=A0A183A1L2_9TREM